MGSCLSVFNNRRARRNSWIMLTVIAEDRGRDGDGEGSEGSDGDKQDHSDDNSKSSEASKDFEFVQKE